MRRFVIPLAVVFAVTAAIGGVYMTTGSADSGEGKSVARTLPKCEPDQRASLNLEPGDMWDEKARQKVSDYNAARCGGGLGRIYIRPGNSILRSLDPELVAGAVHNTIIRVEPDWYHEESDKEIVRVWIYTEPEIQNQIYAALDGETLDQLNGLRLDDEIVRIIYADMTGNWVLPSRDGVRISRYPIPPGVLMYEGIEPVPGTIKSATATDIVLWDESLPGEYKEGPGIPELLAVRQHYTWWRFVREMSSEEVLELLRPDVEGL